MLATATMRMNKVDMMTAVMAMNAALRGRQMFDWILDEDLPFGMHNPKKSCMHKLEQSLQSIHFIHLGYARGATVQKEYDKVSGWSLRGVQCSLVGLLRPFYTQAASLTPLHKLKQAPTTRPRADE